MEIRKWLSLSSLRLHNSDNYSNRNDVQNAQASVASPPSPTTSMSGSVPPVILLDSEPEPATNSSPPNEPDIPPPPQSPTSQAPAPQSPSRPGLSSTQSSSPPIKRRRVRPRSPTPPPTEKQDSIDDENQCLICLEPWDNTGEHQICCMPCGHLFGYKCINKWLRNQHSRNRACPTCKHPSRVRDLRYIFGVPSRLQTTDVSVIHGLKEELAKEKKHHRETRERLSESRRIARTYQTALHDLQRAGVRSMQSAPQTDIDEVRMIGVRRTNGRSNAVACDGATVLYTEFSRAPFEQRLCRAEINRLNHVTTSPHTCTKRINALAVCQHRELSRYIALASADRKVTVLNPSLQLAAEVTVSAVPTSARWLSTPHHLAVGLLNGEVSIFDIRNPSCAPVLRPLVAVHGWRAVHSLTEVKTDAGATLLAGSPCGVFTISGSGIVQDVDVGDGPISGISSNGGMLLVAKKNDKPHLEIHNGLEMTPSGTPKLGNRIGELLSGYKHEMPFIQPVILPGMGDTKGSIIACPDTSAEHGMATWGFRRDGVEGERWVSQSASSENAAGVRAVACASIPSTARIVGLPERVRGIFAAVSDDSVRVFSAGRYR